MLAALQQDGVISHEGRNVRWALRFQEDLERIYIEEIRARHHHPKLGTNLSELGRTFHQLCRGRLEHLHGKRLRVQYSREIEEHRSRPAIAELARRAEQGEPLWPYLSKHARKANFHDDLLNHWGIVHLHLGEGLDKWGFVKRCGDHLYAWVAEPDLYFIRVRNHSFADEELLNIVVRNWPHLLAPFRLPGGCSGTTTAAIPGLVKQGTMKRFTRTVLVHRTPQMSEAQTTALRDAGVTPTFTAETGEHYSAPGGGVSGSGAGIYPQILADHEAWWASQIAGALTSELPQLVAHVETHAGPGFDALEFHIESLDALRDASVIEHNAKIRFNLPMKFDRDFDPASVIAPIARAAAAVRR